MPSTVYRFYGTTKWAKVQEPDQKYNRYSLDLYMDDASWRLYKKSGLQLKIRESEEGEYVSFGRAAQKIIKGKMVEQGKPKVCDPLGKEIVALVGNGSEVAVEVSVYDTIKGKSHTLEKVEVIGLVEYSKKVDAHDAEQNPGQVASGSSKSNDSRAGGVSGKPRARFNADTFNDEIPF